MAKKESGTTIIVILAAILVALLVATGVFLYPRLTVPLDAPHPSTAPQISAPPTTKRQPPTSRATEPKPTEKVTQPVVVSPVDPNNPAGWPKVSAADGRKNLGIPYELKGIILVNRKHPVNWDYVPEVVRNDDGALLAPVAMEAYKKMKAAAAADGITFYFRSGYRSFAYQVQLRQQYLATDPGGEDAVDRYSAPPGCSEHQTGLAVDLDNGHGLMSDFDETPAGKWLQDNAYKFGFIVRFPKGKEFITGYEYEPWHFRYIGVKDAKNFGPHNKLTLEEYLGAEPAPAPWRSREAEQSIEKSEEAAGGQAENKATPADSRSGADETESGESSVVAGPGQRH